MVRVRLKLSSLIEVWGSAQFQLIKSLLCVERRLWHHGFQIRWLLISRCARMKENVFFSGKNTRFDDSFDVTKCLQQIEKPDLLHVCAQSNKQPSNLKTMILSRWFLNKLCTLIKPLRPRVLVSTWGYEKFRNSHKICCSIVLTFWCSCSLCLSSATKLANCLRRLAGCTAYSWVMINVNLYYCMSRKQ